MPKNKTQSPAPVLGAGNQEGEQGQINEKYIDELMNNEEFRDIIDHCMGKCYSDCPVDVDDIDCAKKCFRTCSKAAWILWHEWHTNVSTPTA